MKEFAIGILENGSKKKFDLKSDNILLCLSLKNNKIISLDLSNCPSIKELYCYSNKISKLDISQNVNLVLIDARDNQNLFIENNINNLENILL